MEIKLHPVTVSSPEVIAEKKKDPGFGRVFSDRMFCCRHTVEKGWHEAEIVPYGPLSLDPAANVLHYGQAIFEGLKAQRTREDKIVLFRPTANALRMRGSAAQTEKK